jgi:Tol biopolymer transport system component
MGRVITGLAILWSVFLVLSAAALATGQVFPAGLLAYTRIIEARETRIMLMDRRTGVTLGLEQMQPALRGLSTRNPRWSPDGTRLAFTTVSPARDLSVHDIDMTTNTLRNLTALYGYNTRPFYIPGSTDLAFTPSPGAASALYVVRSDTTDPALLLNPVRGQPAWSHDGTLLLYLRENPDEDGERISATSNATLPEIDLYLWDTVRDDTRNLTANLTTHGSPRWSPDNRTVAFQSEYRPSGRIMLLDVASQDVTLVPNDTDSSSDSRPRWSPDGRYLAFGTHRDGNSEIYIMDTTTRTIHNLSNHPAYDVQHTWLDAAHLAFVSARDGQQEIYSVHVAGGTPRRLTFTRGNEQTPAGQP